MTNEINQIVDSITAAEIDAFWKDGAIALRGVFEKGWLDLLAKGIEKTVDNPTPYGRVQSKPDDPGWFFTDYYMWKHYNEFETVARQGPGGAIASKLLVSTTINYFYEGLFLKEPWTRRASDWHQDQPYYNVDGKKLCVIWIPLDRVTEETTLWVIKGSHLSGNWYQPTFFAQERTLKGAEELFVPMPDIDSNPDQFEVMAWPLEPGDVVVFHPLCIHGAGGNPTGTRRRALQTVFLGEDCVYGKRMSEVEPKIEGYPFQPGDRLDIESVFPSVWPRS